MSKIFTLLAIAVFTSFDVSAQTSKGTVLLGGSLGFDHSKATNTTPEKNTSFRISPNVSKFYKDNRLVGGGISFSHASGSYTGNLYGLNFFLRQYLPMGKDFFLFADETLYGSTSKYRYSGTLQSRTDKTTSAGISFNPGLAYAVNKKFQLEIGLPDMASLYYNHQESRYSYNPSNNSKSNAVGLSTGLSELFLGSLSFGIKVVLN